MNKNEESNSTLEQVDARRRGFLEQLLTGGVVVALPAMSTVALGQNQQFRGKGKGGKGKGSGRPDPKRLAGMLIKLHDKDGDKALNQKELEAALTAMFSRRGGQGKGQGQGGSGKGKGKGKGNNSLQGGGVKPKRPTSN